MLGSEAVQKALVPDLTVASTGARFLVKNVGNSSSDGIGDEGRLVVRELRGIKRKRKRPVGRLAVVGVFYGCGRL
jgi:hypothetical protein